MLSFRDRVTQALSSEGRICLNLRDLAVAGQSIPVQDGDVLTLVPAIVGGAPAADKLSRSEILRYSCRLLIMPEVTLEGQRRLKKARVLCVGAGGLGSPLSLYLAAAGVGTLEIVDFDVVAVAASYHWSPPRAEPRGRWLAWGAGV
jgi:adenylyltransferase/sulfurtransferase